MSAANSDAGDVRRHVLLDLVKYFPSNLLPGVGYLVGVAVFTRAFTAGSYGWYVLADAVAPPAIGLLTQWLVRPAMRFYAEYQTAGEGPTYEEAVSSAVGWAFVGVLTLGAIAAAVLATTGWLQAHMVLATGEMAFVAFSVPNAVALSVMRSGLRAGLFFSMRVAAEVVGIAFPLIMIFGVSRDVGWLAWGQAMSVIIVLPNALRLTRLTPRAVRWRLSAEHRAVLGRFWRYGAPMVGWFVGANLLAVESRYLLQAFVGSHGLGVYGANYDLMNAASGVLNGTVVLGFGPALFHHWAKGRREQVKRAISDATDLYLLVGLGFIGGVAVAGPSLEQVLVGSHFRVGAGFLVPAAAALILFGLGMVGHACLELGEGTWAMASSAIVAAAVNLSLGVILIPVLKVEGAVYVTMIAYASYCCLIWAQSWRLSGEVVPFRRFRSMLVYRSDLAPRSVPWVIRWSAVARAVASAAVACYVGVTSLLVIGGPPAIQLVCGVFAYSVVWLVMAFIVKGEPPWRLVGTPAAQVSE